MLGFIKLQGMKVAPLGISGKLIYSGYFEVGRAMFMFINYLVGWIVYCGHLIETTTFPSPQAIN